MTQKSFSKITTATFILFFSYPGPLHLQLLLGEIPFFGYPGDPCLHFIQVSTKPTHCLQEVLSNENYLKCHPHRPTSVTGCAWFSFLLSGIVLYSSAGSWSAVWTECSQRFVVSSHRALALSSAGCNINSLVQSCWKLSIESPHRTLLHE